MAVMTVQYSTVQDSTVMAVMAKSKILSVYFFLLINFSFTILLSTKHHLDTRNYAQNLLQQIQFISSTNLFFMHLHLNKVQAGL